MAFYNKVILLGNVTRDVEVKTLESGTVVANTGIAVTEKFKSNGETKESTCFVDLVAYGKIGEIFGEYVTKGMPILVEGKLNYRTWEQDGQKRSKHEIVVTGMQMLGGKKSDAGDELPEPDEDDIPF